MRLVSLRRLLLGAIFGLLAVPATALAAGTAKCPGAYNVTGLIGQTYKRLGGSTGALGCPIGNEQSAEGPGRVQHFKNGDVGVSPNTGPKSVQAAWLQGNSITVDWAETTPFQYDFFLVRWDRDGQNAGQSDVHSERTKGQFLINKAIPGRYRITVAGCNGKPAAPQCSRGWSNPIYVNVPAPPFNYHARPIATQKRAVDPVSCPTNQFLSSLPKAIDVEWMHLGGPNGAMGCPRGGAIKRADGMLVAQFDNGMIAAGGRAWPDGAIGVFQQGDGFYLDWNLAAGAPSGFTYNKFIVRWDIFGPPDAKGHPKLLRTNQVDVKKDRCDGLRPQVCANNYFTDVNLGPAPPPAPAGGVIAHYSDFGFTTAGQLQIPATMQAFGAKQFVFSVEGCDLDQSGSLCRQGWFGPVSIVYNSGPDDPAKWLKDPKTNWSIVDYLNMGTRPTTIADASAHFEDRLAAVVKAYACNAPLDYLLYRQEEGAPAVALAKLAYADYFTSDKCPGRDVNNRDEVFDWLRKQWQISLTGTSRDSGFPFRTGDYDIAESRIIPMIYRYYDVMPEDVRQHVIFDLFNKVGKLDPADLTVFGAGPETENHVLMMWTSQYLINQLRWMRTVDDTFDNDKNGNSDVMLALLRNRLTSDFREYNSKPYGHYSAVALENLYSYSSNLAVKEAAHLVLDYLTAKMAVSSNGARRVAPYRRHVVNNDPSFLCNNTDTWTGRAILLSGNADGYGAWSPAGFNLMPSFFTDDAVLMGLSDYRLPDETLDLFLRPDGRKFIESFHYGSEDLHNVSGVTGHFENDERYAGSPSYLLSAGGHWMPWAYAFLSPCFPPFCTDATNVDPDDAGVAQPTTLIPNGAGRSRWDFIRFEGNVDDTQRWNMCVATDFACGLRAFIPRAYLDRKECFERRGNNMFFNVADNCARDSGAYYVALFLPDQQADDGKDFDPTKGGCTKQWTPGAIKSSYGVLEVLDLKTSPGMTFEDFVTAVNANNPRPFTQTGTNTYVKLNRERIDFTIGPKSTIVNGAIPPLNGGLVAGTILQQEAPGKLSITNSCIGKKLILDDSNQSKPVRTEVTTAVSCSTQVPCGAFGQPCCPQTFTRCDAPYSCQAGTCTCAAAGQSCAQSSECCSAYCTGTCSPGGIGQVCPHGDSDCSSGKCVGGHCDCLPIGASCSNAVCCPAPGQPAGSTVCANGPNGAPICQLYKPQTKCQGVPRPIQPCKAQWTCCGTDGWVCGKCS